MASDIAPAVGILLLPVLLDAALLGLLVNEDFSTCTPLFEKTPPTLSRKVMRRQRNSPVALPPLSLFGQLQAMQTGSMSELVCESLIPHIPCGYPPYFPQIAVSSCNLNHNLELRLKAASFVSFFLLLSFHS